jgi:hypothetical protein
LGIILVLAGVVTTLRMSAKNSVEELIDYATYFISSCGQLARGVPPAWELSRITKHTSREKAAC